MLKLIKSGPGVYNAKHVLWSLVVRRVGHYNEPAHYAIGVIVPRVTTSSWTWRKRKSIVDAKKNAHLDLAGILVEHETKLRAQAADLVVLADELKVERERLLAATDVEGPEA